MMLVHILSLVALTAAQSTLTANSTAQFVCLDGYKIDLPNVCDGTPHCPDASDEVRMLCYRTVCPLSMYRCAYGACISRTHRCDGTNDCVDASDELHCNLDPKFLCSDREFQCFTEKKECIPLAATCDAHVDCSDGSDETESTCRDSFCPDDTFRCMYGGCIYRELLCDGIQDCLDGSDEDSMTCAAMNCNATDCEHFTCRDDEFQCKSGDQCIIANKTCDGVRHCRDSSDEDSAMCTARECPKGWFRCAYGGCIRSELQCNLRPDCYDWSDEDEQVCGIKLPKGACRLPSAKPATHYKVSGCPQCRPGDVVPELTRLNYSCDVENSLEGPSSVYCQNNRWIPRLPTCVGVNTLKEITCPALVESHGAMRKCNANWGPKKGWIPCDQPVPVGTRIFFQCPEFYERVAGSSSIVCLHDGTYSQRPLRCEPTCGRRSSSASTLIVHGQEVTPKESLPWQATLFSRESGQWKLFCGGTLIAERIVLTAGHCVWESLPDTIQIGFALFSANISELNETGQLLPVEMIIPQTSYQDYEGNYGSDLALIILKRPVIINNYVSPACIDWDSDATLKYAVRNNQSGLVAGFGVTENDTYSQVLRMISVPIVSDKVCRENQRPDFQKYLTYTTFCGGWANGTGVCNGDSGGGLVLMRPDSSVWEVHGVVSLSPRKLGISICDPMHYTIFTKVFLYSQWIRGIVNKFPVIGQPDPNLHPNTDMIRI